MRMREVREVMEMRVREVMREEGIDDEDDEGGGMMRKGGDR